MHCFSIDEETTCAACYPITPQQSHTLSNPAQFLRLERKNTLTLLGLKMYYTGKIAMCEIHVNFTLKFSHETSLKSFFHVNFT